MAAGVPFDQREGVIWMNGEMVPWADAKVHVLTHGLHYASAVFEGERAYGGEIFKLTEHTERLHESARILGFKIPYSVAEIDDACRKVLTAQGYSDAYVRPVAWRGSEMMGVSAQNNRINLAIAIWEWPSYFDPEQRLKGIRLDLAEYRRPDPKTAPCKSKAAGLYMICTLSKHAAESKGYADAMMLDWRGYVAEATGANVFFVKDGVLHTPNPDCFLDGITRRTVIGLARKRASKSSSGISCPRSWPIFPSASLRALLRRLRRFPRSVPTASSRGRSASRWSPTIWTKCSRSPHRCRWRLPSEGRRSEIHSHRHIGRRGHGRESVQAPALLAPGCCAVGKSRRKVSVATKPALQFLSRPYLQYHIVVLHCMMTANLLFIVVLRTYFIFVRRSISGNSETAFKEEFT